MIAGIDLGTTHSLAGVVDGGFPVLVPNRHGERLTPSAVWFQEGGRVVVGREALAARAADAGRVAVSVKRLMGRRTAEAQGAACGCPLGAGPRGEAGLMVDGRWISPEEVSAEILRSLKGDLERFCGQAVDRAVITVPAYFNDAQRSATKRAGELAGFSVERILSEPTAAALAYGLDRLGGRARVAVYDLGGGTFDISVLELNGGVFEVLATNGDTRLGGDDLDAALAAEWGIAAHEAERIKRLLGEAESVSESGREFLRTELELVCLPIIERTRTHCLRSLSDAELKAGDLDAVVLVGGATRMPLVRNFVAGVFGREPDTSQNPDEAVALGATIQAGVLSGAVQNVTLLDVTPLSLGIETFGGLMNVIIPRNTTIPCKAGEMFTNAAANQASMRITVLQGEREMARDNWRLGEMEVAFPPALKGQARVGVQFAIDADGILEVLARDTATGKDMVLEIRSAVELSDEAVEKMLGDALDHAFEDMDERVFTEAKMKAEEMLPAVEAALEALGGAVDGETRVQVLELSAKARESLAAKNAADLKNLLTELDRATEPLAAMLVERAMGGRV
ncbi:MAG: Hsp70 family protein [Terrimicrobiaceae bacterium]